jgi:hypothetical protein
VDVQGAPTADALRQRVNDSLTSRLQAAGLKVAAAGDVRLVVQMGPAMPTGQMMLLEEIGRGQAKINIPIQQVACRAVLTDARGAVLWEQKQQQRTPDIGFRIIRTQDPQADFVNALWNNCANWSAGLQVPTLLVRTAGGVEPLPKFVSLKGDR